MSQDPSPGRRQRRASLSKQDILSGAAAELLVLLETVTADGRVSDEEGRMLHEWLADKDLADLPGITFLRGILETVLADGVITGDERREIYRAIEKVLPVELRRDAVERRSVFETAERLRCTDEPEEECRQEISNLPLMTLDFMVAGCAYESRQDTIARHVRDGLPVHFHREPENCHDANAIVVSVADRGQIGYVPREDAAFLAPLLDQGFRFKAYIRKTIEGRNYDIPVVVAHVYSEHATI